MSTQPFAPPALGVGMVYFPSFEPLLQQCGEWLDVIEVEPQAFWLRGTEGGVPRLDARVFDRLAALPQRKLLHGTGLPLAGSVPLDAQQAAPWRETIHRLQPAWVSEHLAFARVPDGASHHHAGFLLPPLQSAETVNLAVQRIAALRARSGRPVAFETAPNYLRPQPGEMADGAFFAEVAERADCGIVLDLHNLWCNERNGRQRVREVLEQLPLERVWEVHLAGGQSHRGYWLDAHSDLVPGPVMALLEEWLPRLPRAGAVIFEILPEYVAAKGLSDEQLRGQIEAVKRLWNRRRRAPAAPPPPRRLPVEDGLPAAHWERALGALVNGRPAPGAPAWLAGDPGIAVYRALVESGRAANLVEPLALSYRLLVLTLGDAATWQLLRDFWAESWPQAQSLDEALAFEAFIATRLADGRLAVPNLHPVLAHELAHAQAAARQRELFVPFDSEAPALLSALASGQLPAERLPGHYEVHGAG